MHLVTDDTSGKDLEVSSIDVVIMHFVHSGPISSAISAKINTINIGVN